jgi:hypothetical protein
MKPINWYAFHLTNRLTTNCLIVGEERMLTPNDVRNVNNLLEEMSNAAEKLSKIFNVARQRFTSKQT